MRSAEVLYPAPHRFTDASGTAIGYEDEVVFPVMVTPERLDEPVELKLNVDYGLCKTLCIPNQANLSIELPAQAAGKAEDPLAQHVSSTSCRRLPRRASCRRLAASRPSSTAPSPSLSSTRISLTVPPAPISSSRAGEMFVPVPKPLGPAQNGKQRFVVSFASPAEAAAIRGKSLTLTFVSDEGAREASVTVE